MRCNISYVSSATMQALICNVWAHRLAGGCWKAVFLPYSLNDEYVEAFEVHAHGPKVTLICTTLDGIGYDHGEDDPVAFMSSAIHVLARREQSFCHTEFSELLAGIRTFCAVGAS